MTVCIGALAENGQKLVLVSDKMITANIPIAYQFQKPDVQKIYPINNNAQVLTAGNALYAHEIVRMAVKRVAKERLEGKDAHSVEEITEIIRSIYQAFRLQKVVQLVLEPRGLSLDAYYSNQQRLHQGMVGEIEQNLVNYNIGVELIVAGINPGDGCHLYSITHPGVSACHDTIGYACVGSGAPHALYSLIASEYTKDKLVGQVEAYVDDAKKKSEVAPGVGTETEKIILPPATIEAVPEVMHTAVPVLDNPQPPV